MTIKKQLRQYVGKRTAKRVTRVMPFVAGAVAFAIGNAIRERGVRASVNGLRDAITRDRGHALEG